MRKRKKLEVSTFPFLAVLLCTMGSLILLLLVMDKKAKKAALEKAYEATWTLQKNLQAKTNADNENTDSEKNAWIKLKTEQHEENIKKESALEKEILSLKAELAQIEKKNKQYGSINYSEEFPKKETALSEEKSRINYLAKKLESEKAIADKNLKDAKNLTEKIVTMELILKELKASINKDKFAYSIVPYFGKNGLNRKPLYIECNESGILLFPDKTLIPSNDESDNLKNELLTRTSQLREYLLQTLGPKDSTPYLMILVRPEGITNYWKLQSIIKPMDIDFGYELVDKIWVLDIPIEQSAPAPSKLAKMIRPIPRPIPAPGNIRGGINNGNGGIPQQNNADINNDIYQNQNNKRNGSSDNSKSISYGATASNIRPITAIPGYPGSKGANNVLTNNNPNIINNPNGSRLGNNNPNGNGLANSNPNSNGLGNSNLNGNGLANNNPKSNGLGNSNPNGNGLANNNPKSNGLGNSNPNGNGFGNDNPNGNGLANNNPKSNGLGNNTATSNSIKGNNLDSEKNSTKPNNANHQKPNNLKTSTEINNRNSEMGDSPSQKINTDNGISGGNVATNTGNSGTGGASDSKGSYSASTKPNSFSEDNQNGKIGSAAGSPGNENESSNKINMGGNAGTQDNQPNKTTKNENVKSIGSSNSQDAQPANPNQSPNISISLNNKTKDETKATTKQNNARTTYNREDESQSNSEAQDPTARIAAPLPELGPRKTQAPTPLRAARLFADRDWVIFVECKFEEILVHPNRLVIPTSLLASDEGVKRFVQEIEKIIQRKQSTVRPGEPPYRPEVRFLVWPDGLRPYHLSYPALQLAGIKQKRQNLESEDNIKEIIQGR